MRLRKPGSKPFRGVGTERRARLEDAGRGVLEELVAIAREMLRIPAGLYMRAAEAAGRATLRAWLVAWPILQAAWRLTTQLFRLAEREVTPMRAALAVTAVTAVALAASQFADYRSVAIGTAEYIGVDQVAPAPEVADARARGGSAHAWVGLPLALAALAVVAACAARRRAALWLVPIGLATVAVSVFVDAPKGLDEGSAAVAYEGAKATLLGGFWVQLACGALLVALGPLINGLLSPSGATAGRRPPRMAGVPAREAGG